VREPPEVTGPRVFVAQRAQRVMRDRMVDEMDGHGGTIRQEHSGSTGSAGSTGSRNALA